MIWNLVVVVALWLGLLAADPNSSSSWVGGAAALSLLTIAIGFNIRQYRSQARDIKTLKVDKARDRRVCNYQLSVLAEVLEEQGIAMPPRFWNIPDDEILVQEEQRRHPEQSGGATLPLLFSVLAFVAVAIFVISTATNADHTANQALAATVRENKSRIDSQEQQLIDGCRKLNAQAAAVDAKMSAIIKTTGGGTALDPALVAQISDPVVRSIFQRVLDNGVASRAALNEAVGKPLPRLDCKRIH